MVYLICNSTMSFATATLCGMRATQQHAKKFGINETSVTGLHVEVHISTTQTIPISRNCDALKILKLKATCELQSMTYCGCVYDFPLINLCTDNQYVQKEGEWYVYTILHPEWRYVPRHFNVSLTCAPCDPTIQDMNVAAIVEYQYDHNLVRANRVNCKLVQSMVTHFTQEYPKQMGKVARWSMYGYSLTNGVFLHNLCVDEIEQIEVLFDANTKVKAMAPHIHEVVRVYPSTNTLYIPFNGTEDPFNADRTKMVNLGRVRSIDIQCTFKEPKQTNSSVKVQTIDVIDFHSNGGIVPGCHPHFKHLGKNVHQPSTS